MELGLSEALIKIADKLGVTANEIFRIHVEAQPAIAISNAIATGALLLFGGVGSYIAYRFIKGEVEAEKKSREERGMYEKSYTDAYITTIGLGLLVGGVAGIIVGDIASDLFLRTVAPEYTAFQDIVAQLRGFR